MHILKVKVVPMVHILKSESEFFNGTLIYFIYLFINQIYLLLYISRIFQKILNAYIIESESHSN